MWIAVRDQMPAETDKVVKPTDRNSLTLEAWIEGYLIGSLIIMACITIANMRRGVILHKLILVELLLGIWSGLSMLINPPVYSWYLSTTGLCMYISYTLHNTIAWIKNKPFLSRKASRFYIGTVILVVPYWVVNAYANYTYYNNINKWFLKTRPIEAIFRDPWWVFTTVNLFWNVKTRYDFGFREILRISPRFAIMLTAMTLSLVFLVLDILSVTSVLKSVLPIGVNPFWKFSFIFKCLTDTAILDDFKTALDKMHQVKIGQFANTGIGAFVQDDYVQQPPALGMAQPPQTSTKPMSEHLEHFDPLEIENGMRMDPM